jgi:hypothetical protein
VAANSVVLNASIQLPDSWDLNNSALFLSKSIAFSEEVNFSESAVF